MKLSGESAQGTARIGEPSPTSADLISRARHGDGAAWAVLVHAHQEPAFRLAYLFLGDADEAEDIAQETFIRAYQALERYDVERPLRPWLLSIAANLARNRRRSIGRFMKAWKKLVREADTLPSLEQNALEQHWQSRALWDAVRRLNQNDQHIIYLRYFLDMSVEETATSLEIAEGTVKSRLHRAIDRLREIIQRGHPDLKDFWK